MKLLLLSASRVGNTEFLAHTLPHIENRLADIAVANRPLRIAFIPFAAVSFSYDEYEQKVVRGLSSLNVEVSSIHHHADPSQALEDADAILVGGGNTFALLDRLYQYKLLEVIRKLVHGGKPYIGWSAGSNIAGLSIKTTNDMPIVEPESFAALQLVPCQLNPHYLDKHPPGFNGETRDMRLAEFMVVEPHTEIIGLPEGTALKVDGNQTQFIGELDGYRFINQKKILIPVNSVFTLGSE